MGDVDALMLKCPLKQEIRASLWEAYVKRVIGSRKLRKLLTLYSPPLMDVKHLHHRGLLEFTGESYPGVVAVTYTEEHLATSITLGGGRPELLLYGHIDQLLASPTPKGEAKRLRDAFPFEVINLDYTDSMFVDTEVLDVPSHLKAIDVVVRHQQESDIKKWALLVTTRAEQALIPQLFLGVLTQKVDDNLAHNEPFGKSYRKVCGDLDGAGLLALSYERFIPVGLAKLIADIVVDRGFELGSVDAVLLVRDAEQPTRWLLHLAFLVQKGTAAPTAKSLRRLGRDSRYHLERRLGAFVEKNAPQGAKRLIETIDRVTLEAIHGGTLQTLAERTIDLPIPEPEQTG